MPSSFGIKICDLFTVMLLGLCIGLEIPAYLNDQDWNEMKDNPEKRFSFEDLQNCNQSFANGTPYYNPTLEDYDNIFLAKKRDLPYELHFLILCTTSFFVYLIFSLLSCSRTRKFFSIYLSLILNLLGTFAHLAAFLLILASALTYSWEDRDFMGAKACYKFRCDENCTESFEENQISYLRLLHFNTRFCLEELHVCHSNWLKDRVVYLVFACFVSSAIGLYSSIGVLRRRSKDLQDSSLLEFSKERT